MGAAAKDGHVTDQTPVLLITRPAPEGERLADRLHRECPEDYDILLAPLIGIEPVASDVDPAGYAAVIFTSVNGVTHAGDLPRRPGQTAFCVGDRTAEAAREAGFDAHSAGGAAEELIALILSHPERGPLLHLRGADTRGDIAEKLGKAGRDVTSAIVYEQRVLPLGATARAALQGPAPVIVPLYSPNTAKALLNQAPYRAPLDLIVISEAVAEVARQLHPASLTTATQPDGEAMVASIRAALGGKSGRSGP